MYSLLFLCELIAIVVVAYWTYANDKLGPKGGSEGLLRMRDEQQKVAAVQRKRVPKWRQNRRDAPTPPGFGSPRARRPAPAEPAWKRRRGRP